jgi:glycosyltransferase involved in cell wall biosynthesis
MALDLTIAIPVKNEEHNLPGCLDAIGTGFAERIVVLDSGSTDGTMRIAKEQGAEVLDFRWNGRFPKKRNWFLREHPPKTRWILFLDADEVLTAEFKDELRRTLPTTGHSGFWLHYSIYFMGKKLRGGYPLDKLALFRVGAGEYEHIEEQEWSRLDMEVHEHPLIQGTIGSIGARIDHLDQRGITHWVAKHNEYSSWEAARFLASRRSAQIHTSWTPKQKLKYALMQTPLLGVAYFFGSFFGMGGWKDGSRGLAFALLKMSYFTQLGWKIREGRRQKSLPQQPATNSRDPSDS